MDGGVARPAGALLQATATPTDGGGVDVWQPEWLPPWIPPELYADIVRLLLALLVLVVAYYISGVVREMLGRRVARQFGRPSVTRTVLRSIQLGIVLLGGFVAFYILGLQISNIALSVGVFSAVLGIVLAPLVGSLISGVFVLSERAYEIGDMIELRDAGVEGFVEDITLRYTKIFTMDNTFMVIPNGTIRERDVINYSAEDARTRLRLDLLVTYESDIAQARRVMERAARRVDVVIEGGPDIRIGSARYPAAPTCYINEFADSGVLLTLRYWVTEPYKLLTARSHVQTNVWETIHEDGVDVEIAYPHSHLVFDETSGELQVDLDGDAGAAPSREADGPAGPGRPGQHDPAGEHSDQSEGGGENGAGRGGSGRDAG